VVCIEGAAALGTGAASGLGRAAAERLHAADAKVVLADTNQEAGKELADAGVREFKQPPVIEDRPIPQASDGQILVKIAASGLFGEGSAMCS
jgi:NAD(P)-dependent dehydrogenase (short-subunit alcohol dehydrogenase family)